MAKAPKIKGTIMRMRVTHAELSRLKKAAKKAGETMSEWAREILKKAAIKEIGGGK